GKLIVDKGLDPNILKPDGVDHAATGLPDARRWIAIHRLARKTFHDEAAERVQIHLALELDTVGEGPGGGQDGIFQGNPAERDLQAHFTPFRSGANAALRTRPEAEEGGATRSARASVGAMSTESTGSSWAPGANCGP